MFLGGCLTGSVVTLGFLVILTSVYDLGTKSNNNSNIGDK